MTGLKKRTQLPQLRNFTGERSASDARSQRLQPESAQRARFSWVWAGVGAAAVLLILVAAAPVWLPMLSLIIPDAYLVTYAPEPIQQLIFQTDPQAQVPTPIPQVNQSPQGVSLLTQIAPTPTPMPTQAENSRPIVMIQPTPVALAATMTFTPVFAPPLNAAAEDSENEADLSAAIALLHGFDYEVQGFNNCGPASIRVLMSYWNTKYGDAEFSEGQAAAFLKPTPNDPNVRPDEIGAYVEKFGYHALLREGGDFETLEQFILAGYPVLIETGYDPEPTKVGWTSHYLTIVGYSMDQFIVMDTYNRPNWGMDRNEVDYYWRQFNRHYLIIYRPEQYAAVASIVGADMDDTVMLDGALETARAEVALDPNDAFGWFNLGTTLVQQERYEEAAQAYDEARRIGLPGRMLWYQFGPYEAYLQVGRYEDVIQLAEDVIKGKSTNEEAYYYKALALEQLGEVDKAIAELGTALRLNHNFEWAKDARDRMMGD